MNFSMVQRLFEVVLLVIASLRCRPNTKCFFWFVTSGYYRLQEFGAN